LRGSRVGGTAPFKRDVYERRANRLYEEGVGGGRRDVALEEEGKKRVMNLGKLGILAVVKFRATGGDRVQKSMAWIEGKIRTAVGFLDGRKAGSGKKRKKRAVLPGLVRGRARFYDGGERDEKT